MQLLTAFERIFASDDGPQAASVFGTAKPGAVAVAVADLVWVCLDSEVVDCAFDYVSAGVTLGLELSDARRVVLKACRPETLARGAVEVQAALAQQGFPAPAVLSMPTRCRKASAYLMEPLDRGEPVIYDARVRDTMASEYARLIGLCRAIEPKGRLLDRSGSGETLWPTPHSVIFDFEGTREESAMIDEIAALAKQAAREAETSPQLVAHCDWALQNVSFQQGALTGVFDWESVGWTSEVEAVAGAAAFHCQDWFRGPDAYEHDFYPGPEWTQGFIDSYAEARGFRFDAAEERLLQASLVYRLAYQARCGRALEPSRVGPAEERLLLFARELGFMP